MSARAASPAVPGAHTTADTEIVEVSTEAGFQPPLVLTITLRDDAPRDGNSDGATATLVDIEASGTVTIPFFGWFFRPLAAIARRRARDHALAVLRAELDGAPEPRPPKPVMGLPPVAFAPDQAILLATASAAVAVVSFSSALFGQLAGPIGDAFGASDAKLGVALALTRIGALFALVATAVADRRGRRRSILIGVVGSSAVCAISAVAPNLAVFTGAQMLQRGFVITTATVAGIAVIEEAPERARAYAASMLALAGGFGFSFSVLCLPLGDIGTNGWRIPFAIGAGTILFAPRIAQRLAETTRYQALAARREIVRGRMRDIVDRGYGKRFLVLAAVAFCTSVFSAPSSQFMNKYLEDVRNFSGTGIALFRTVTTAVPGLLGLLIGGRLADVRGRRPVAAIFLAVAAATQIVFFLGGGPLLWFMSAASILASGAGGIALGTLDAELFPTEVRSTSNALLIVVGVAGSSVGLVTAGGLSDPLGGLGRSIALTGLAALFAAIVLVPLLPESGMHRLDDISPTDHTPGTEYGPGA